MCVTSSVFLFSRWNCPALIEEHIVCPPQMRLPGSDWWAEDVIICGISYSKWVSWVLKWLWGDPSNQITLAIQWAGGSSATPIYIWSCRGAKNTGQVLWETSIVILHLESRTSVHSSSTTPCTRRGGRATSVGACQSPRWQTSKYFIFGCYSHFTDSIVQSNPPVHSPKVHHNGIL